MSISDVKFTLGSGVGGSTFNASTGQWYNPENNTAHLLITADFAATTVPEPASLALLSSSILGLGLIIRRRKQGGQA